MAAKDFEVMEDSNRSSNPSSHDLSDPFNERAEVKGSIVGDIYGCPDGIAFDARGVLWIQTDAHATQMYKGKFARIGNNQMLACDPRSGQTRRFLTGPTNSDITGAA